MAAFERNWMAHYLQAFWIFLGISFESLQDFALKVEDILWQFPPSQIFLVCALVPIFLETFQDRCSSEG